MKKTIILMVSICLCAALSSKGFCGGWGKTNWGMSPATAGRAIGNQIVRSTDNRTDEIYSHKTQQNIAIGKYSFSVHLNFKQNKLDRVMLRLLSKDNYPAYLYFLDELQKKYGPPSIGPTENNMRSGRIQDAKWLIKDTMIHLSYALLIFSDKKSETTLIRYYSRASDVSSDL